MDCLIENSDGEEFDSFCHVPVPLEKFDRLSDEQAEAALKDILGQLALCGVALDFCKHYTLRRAYRLLVEEILPEHRFFPQLRGTGWVQHFSTYEFCPECDAEFEKEYEKSPKTDAKILTPFPIPWMPTWKVSITIPSLDLLENDRWLIPPAHSIAKNRKTC